MRAAVLLITLILLLTRFPLSAQMSAQDLRSTPGDTNDTQATQSTAPAQNKLPEAPKPQKPTQPDKSKKSPWGKLPAILAPEITRRIRQISFVRAPGVQSHRIAASNILGGA
jgi:hypothetical protein